MYVISQKIVTVVKIKFNLRDDNIDFFNLLLRTFLNNQRRDKINNKR